MSFGPTAMAIHPLVARWSFMKVTDEYVIRGSLAPNRCVELDACAGKARTIKSRLATRGTINLRIKREECRCVRAESLGSGDVVLALRSTT
jgi:hypothetical protein